MDTTFTRDLGRSGIQVSAMGLGCWAIGGPFWMGDNAVGWGAVDDEESIHAIHCALDLGVTFFDTADVYGTGHSERVLSRALRDCRDKVVIATKFGLTFDEANRQITGSNASTEYIFQACEASLRRLETDYIDLYQFHLGDYKIDHADAGLNALEELVAKGKVRCYGWSTNSTERARVFAKGSNCTAVQHQMNVIDDAGPMVAICEELNLASINRGPLAMGLLTGKYRADSMLSSDDVRGDKSPGWMKYFRDGRPNPQWLAKVEAVREILMSGGRTLVQGALAWIWARSEKTIPIPGFRTVAQVEENVSAMKYGPLNSDQVKEIDALLNR